MGLAVRFYLFVDDGLQRISHRLMEGLARGKDAIPQLAGTKQKVANVIVETVDGKPARIERADGSFLTFDDHGQVHNDLVASGFAAMETYRALERADQATATGQVIDLAPKLNREKWERENRWSLSKADLDVIADDIWKRRKAASPKVTRAKGILLKPPTVTWEAKQAFKDIHTNIIGIEIKIESLSAPDLKGLSFEAKAKAKGDFDNPLWRAVAELADGKLEILARHRSGLGVWYASVELIQWDETATSGQSVRYLYEKCDSKKEAEEAARRLLAENAKYFSAQMSVDTNVVCDLEWEGEGTVGQNVRPDKA